MLPKEVYQVIKSKKKILSFKKFLVNTHCCGELKNITFKICLKNQNKYNCNNKEFYYIKQ